MDDHRYDREYHSTNHYTDCNGPNCDCDERRYGSHSSNSGKGMSTFGAVLCTVGSFIGTALIFVLLGIDIENIPGIVIIIVWIIIAAVLAVIGSFFGW